jgi:hypothetical protein
MEQKESAQVVLKIVDKYIEHKPAEFIKSLVGHLSKVTPNQLPLFLEEIFSELKVEVSEEEMIHLSSALLALSLNNDLATLSTQAHAHFKQK